MKPVVTEWSRVVHCLRIEPKESPNIYLIEYPHDLTMSNGQVYSSVYGYQFTGIEFSGDGAPPTIDLSSFLGVNGITKAMIAGGIFENARVKIFSTDWSNPVEDEQPDLCGVFGKTSIQDQKYTVEIMGLIDLLGQRVGESFSPLCSLRFGGQEHAGCGIDLVPLRESTTVTGVTDNYTFVCSGLNDSEGFDDDYFGAGRVWFTSGDNLYAQSQKVKSYSAGQFVMAEPFPFAPQIGDSLIAEPGCRKRQAEDCRDKWNNMRRHRGFFLVPGIRFLNSYGDK